MMTGFYKLVKVYAPGTHAENGMEMPCGTRPGAWWTVPDDGDERELAGVYWPDAAMPISADPALRLVEVEVDEAAESDRPQEPGRSFFNRQRILREIPWSEAPLVVAATVLLTRRRLLPKEERETLAGRIVDSRDAFWVLQGDLGLSAEAQTTLASKLSSRDAADLMDRDIPFGLWDAVIRQITASCDARRVLDKRVAYLTAGQIRYLAALL